MKEIEIYDVYRSDGRHTETNPMIILTLSLDYDQRLGCDLWQCAFIGATFGGKPTLTGASLHRAKFTIREMESFTYVTNLRETILGATAYNLLVNKQINRGN